VLLTKGQFSLIDLIRAVLERTGPADLVVSTWTAAGREIEDAAALLGDGRIRSLRWLVDFSFQSRRPDLCGALREAFGDETIRVTRNHAKFVLASNDAWSVVVRTSMNLNKNPRLEYVEVCDDRDLLGFYLWVVDEVFGAQEAGAVEALGPADLKREFSGLGREASVVASGPSPWGKDLDDARRPGISRLDVVGGEGCKATVETRGARRGA